MKPKQVAIATGFFVVFALCAPAGPWPTNPLASNEGPSFAHWLGTDAFGRDGALRLWGAVGSMLHPAILAAGLATLGGVAIGVLAGWVRQPWSQMVRALTTAFLAIPPLVTALLAAMAWGGQPFVLATTVGALGAAHTGLLICGRIVELTRLEYILAARAHGIGDRRILLHHVLRLGCRDLLVRGAVEAAASYLVLDLTLCYLGNFGISEPTPSIGNILVGAIEAGSRNPFFLAAAGSALALLLWPLAKPQAHP